MEYNTNSARQNRPKMKETAIAHSNIAFIKYWGKANSAINIPRNPSISVNLSGLQTITTVEFDPRLKTDDVTIDRQKSEAEAARVTKHLDEIRKIAGKFGAAKVVSENNFPKASGLASSASGFAALTLAATRAAGLYLPERELTTIARLGSGSASRSIPDGFVKWHKGTTHKTSYAESIYPPNYWDITMLAIELKGATKDVGSTEGHAQASTSPFYQQRLKNLPGRISAVEQAISEKDFNAFGKLLEEEALELHLVAMSCKPPILYWQPQSIALMQFCRKQRNSYGLPVYFTFDAGPQPIIFCQTRQRSMVISRIKSVPGIKRIITNTPSTGARLANNHLF